MSHDKRARDVLAANAHERTIMGNTPWDQVTPERREQMLQHVDKSGWLTALWLDRLVVVDADRYEALELAVSEASLFPPGDPLADRIRAALSSAAEEPPDDDVAPFTPRRAKIPPEGP